MEVATLAPWWIRRETWHNDLVVDHVFGGHGEDIGPHGNVEVHLARRTCTGQDGCLMELNMPILESKAFHL